MTTVNGALTGIRSADAKQHGPQWFIGDAVVMGQLGGDGPPRSFDLWYPERGAFQPRLRQVSAYVMGPNGDGSALLGFESTTDKGCLVELNVQTLTVARRACVLPPGAVGSYTVSPRGRWLLLFHIGQSSSGLDHVFHIDLTTVFTKPRPATAWPPDILAFGVWPDESTFISGGPGVLRRITMTQPMQVVEIPLTEVPEAEGGPVFLLPAIEWCCQPPRQ